MVCVWCVCGVCGVCVWCVCGVCGFYAGVHAVCLPTKRSLAHRPLRTNLLGQCLCTGPYPPVTDTGPKTLLIRQCPDSVQITDRYEGLMEAMS